MKLFAPIFYTRNFFILFFALLLFPSCENFRNKKEAISGQLADSTSNPKVQTLASNNLEVKTFEVIDSAGKSAGWGYDIFINGKKTIHQPIIPAMPGNRSFKTEADAQKTGMFALDKMVKEGSLPTILVKELDSLGVIK